MLTESQSMIVHEVENQVRRRMEGQGAGHDVDHVQRVVDNSRTLYSISGGDCFVIELAAWLHDVGDAKFHDGVERSGEFSFEILSELGVESATIDLVVHIVENISFRKHKTASPLSVEGQIVQDADRLEALGAIGIVRTIEYGAMKKQPFYCSDADTPSGIDHFHEKLFHLKDMMNTEGARRLAEQRETFMRDFLDQYMSEIQS